MGANGQWTRFLRNWFEGQYSPDLADHAAKSAQALLNALVGLLQEPAIGNICISHDWNLFLIKEFFLGLRPEDNDYIQYLEGIVIYKFNDNYYIGSNDPQVDRISTKPSTGG
jgi:hypothetical protein